MKLITLKYNERLIKKVALALAELNDKVVYVGGAVIGFYVDDPAAEDVRPTRDIDVFLEIASYSKLTKLQEQLAAKGFFPAMEEGIICRFKYDDLLLDIMATEEVGWASADKWFQPGLKHLEQIQIEETKIKILNISYYLATKFNAFHDRKEDARTIKHFEDIVYVLDNRLNLVSEIIKSPEDVKNYLKNEFLLISDAKYKEAFLGHLYYKTQIERYNMMMEKLSQILKGT